MILPTFILENSFFIKMLFMFMCNKFIIIISGFNFRYSNAVKYSLYKQKFFGVPNCF